MVKFAGWHNAGYKARSVAGIHSTRACAANSGTISSTAAHIPGKKGGVVTEEQFILEKFRMKPG